MARALGFALATLIACSPPPPPPDPPADRLPPTESAANCGVTTEFAQAKFYFADLEDGASCETFVEQDECILAIYKDCTWITERREQSGERQWLGRVDRKADSQEYELRFNPVHERPPAQAPARNCRGDLIDPKESQARAYLDCEGTGFRDFYLEKKDPATTPWGVRDPAERIDVRVTSNVTFDALPEMALIEAPGRRELWTVVNWTAGSDVGGVYSWRIGTPSRTSTRVADIDQVTHIGFNRERGLVLVSEREQSDANGTLHLINADTHAIITSTTVRGSIDKIVSLPGGDRWAIARFDQAARGEVIQILGATDLRSIGAPIDVPGSRIGGMTAVAGGGTVELIVATQFEDFSSQIFGFNRDLQEIWCTPVTNTVIGEVIDLPGKGRVGFIVEARNRYHEVTVQDGVVEAPIPVVQHEELYAAAYDPAADRVFLMSRFGHLSLLSRSARRVEQTDAWEDGDQSDVVWDAGSGRLYVLRPKLGLISPVRPKN